MLDAMPRGGVVVLFVLASCGRLGFDRVGANGNDAGDGGAAAADALLAGGCWPQWRAGTIRFNAPVQLAELRTGFSELDPYILLDGVTIDFVRGLSGTREHYVAVRPDRSSPFGTPALHADINSPQDDGKLAMTGDELLAIYSSDRTGTVGGFDLWQATRSATATPFPAADSAPLAQQNTISNQHDPHLSRDGLRIYYSHGTQPGQHIRVATRATRGDAFGPSVPLTDLGLAVTADPFLSPDELVILYIAAPDVGLTGHLHYATRATTADAFTNAQPVPDVGSTSTDGDPQPTDDGCDLFFASDRGPDRDLFYATSM